MPNQGRSKLSEEMGELLQVMGKIDSYGLGDHPDGKGILLHRFEHEAGDVLGAILFAGSKIGVNFDIIEQQALRKYKLFEEWDNE